MRKLLSGNKRFWTYTPEEIERHLEGRNMTARAGKAAAELRQAERDELRKALGHSTSTEPVSDYDLEHNMPSDPMETASSNSSKERKERGPMMNANSFR
jgi:AGZA family xanthine/uracil permease-like MFS transporter